MHEQIDISPAAMALLREQGPARLRLLLSAGSCNVLEGAIGECEQQDDDVCIDLGQGFWLQVAPHDMGILAQGRVELTAREGQLYLEGISASCGCGESYTN